MHPNVLIRVRPRLSARGGLCHSFLFLSRSSLRTVEKSSLLLIVFSFIARIAKRNAEREYKRKGREGTEAEKGAAPWRVADWLRLATARLPFEAIKIRTEIASRSGVSDFWGVILE